MTLNLSELMLFYFPTYNVNINSMSIITANTSYAYGFLFVCPSFQHIKHHTSI